MSLVRIAEIEDVSDFNAEHHKS